MFLKHIIIVLATLSVANGFMTSPFGVSTHQKSVAPLFMGPILRRIMKRRRNREIKRLKEDFAPDCEVIIAGNTTMSLEDYFAAEANLFASFPDLKIDYVEAAVDDGLDDGTIVVDATTTGTFTGADYVYGDYPAIVATGEALEKETIYTITFEDGLITKFVVIGFDPLFVYETLTETDDSITDEIDAVDVAE